MFDPKKAGILSYLGAIAIVATTALLRAAADPILLDRQPFALFLVAVLVAGRFCGFGPSLLAVVLSALASRYFFVAPRGSLVLPNSVELAMLCFFILFAVFCAFLMRAEQRAKQKLEREI